MSLASKIPEIVIVLAFAVGLTLLARFVKNRIAKSQTKYIANENPAIPQWLLGLDIKPRTELPSPVRPDASFSKSGESKALPDWLKTETPETIRTHWLLDKALGSTNIGTASGMIVVVWQILYADRTASWIISGAFAGAMTGFFYDAALPRGMKAMIGAIAGSSAALVTWATAVGLLSQLFGIVVGTLVGATLGWIISSNHSES